METSDLFDAAQAVVDYAKELGKKREACRHAIAQCEQEILPLLKQMKKYGDFAPQTNGRLTFTVAAQPRINGWDPASPLARFGLAVTPTSRFDIRLHAQIPTPEGEFGFERCVPLEKIGQGFFALQLREAIVACGNHLQKPGYLQEAEWTNDWTPVR